MSISAEKRHRVLIKFMDEEYVESFINEGLIFMNNIQFFREYEDSDPALRGDAKEGLRASYLPENITLELNGRTLTALVGKVELRESHQNETNIYSMTIVSDADILDAGEKGLYLSEDFNKFGNKAVFIGGSDINIFWNRVTEAINNNEDLFTLEENVAKKVTYVDASEHHSELNVFTKFSEYKWQHEWRVALKQISSSGPLELRVGNLSDIAHITGTKSLIQQPLKLVQNNL
ncbi:hypothetical protein PTRA_a1840 [Pseudoalteromonas translucida KMM 520]|uniref:Uncharacterized protein n=1 Tax=Pseudoalteromonas translucida KMM 520 TaxID=1315283 RepID=A0A0U2WZ49_9GAMM|nr:hypothetical protein [Pseudoalteromonas translucida]ALS32993.1 hypothetical protein PTRA_a1840 [Pseudoalteromonas translucida KMM 520]